MIALDTNVLVRLVVRDDPQQLAQAEKLLLATAEQGEACLLTDPVLCELEWVLESSYRASRADILATLQELFSQNLFAFENRGTVLTAIERYQAGKGDFSDYLIGAKGQTQGARVTFTFDRALRAQDGFSPVP